MIKDPSPWMFYVGIALLIASLAMFFFGVVVTVI